ncbi:MAG: hypothetical protein WC284_11745 [Candidimonas sp.]
MYYIVINKDEIQYTERRIPLEFKSIETALKWIYKHRDDYADYDVMIVKKITEFDKNSPIKEPKSYLTVGYRFEEMVREPSKPSHVWSKQFTYGFLVGLGLALFLLIIILSDQQI